VGQRSASFPVEAKKLFKYKGNVRVGKIMLWKDEMAAVQTYKYARLIKVHKSMEEIVCSADVKYKLPGEERFMMTTRPLHKLIMKVPVKKQKFDVDDDGEDAMDAEDGDGPNH
jgi:hypothetical protein